MKKNVLGGSHSRVRSLCTALIPALALFGLASAQAGVLTQYQVAGSKDVGGVTDNYTATLNLQDGYVAGTPLTDSNFSSFTLVQAYAGSSLTNEIDAPAHLTGSIDLASVANTTFSIIGLNSDPFLSADFYDNAGALRLTLPRFCTFPCSIHHQGSETPSLFEQGPPPRVDSATPLGGGAPVPVSTPEPSTLTLMLGALAALGLVRKRSRNLPA